MWGLGPSGETRTAGLLRAWQSRELSHPAYQSPQRADIPRTTRPVGLLASPPRRCPDQGRWGMRTGPSKAEVPTGPSCSQEPPPHTPRPQTTDFQELQRRVSWFATDFCQFEAAKAEGPCCPLCLLLITCSPHGARVLQGLVHPGTDLKALEAKARPPEGRVHPGSHLPVTAAWVA